MGSASSILLEEKTKPLDGKDIDTPRGKSAKDEVIRLRTLISQYNNINSNNESSQNTSNNTIDHNMSNNVINNNTDNIINNNIDNTTNNKTFEGMAPDLKNYLINVFTKADIDQSGILSKTEFSYMIKDQLKLNLTDHEINLLQNNSLVTSNEQITWNDFIEIVPNLLKEITNQISSNPSGSDWCTLTLEDNITNYYYNKRTGESVWEKPVELIQIETIAENTFNQLTPGLQEYLIESFCNADTDTSGTLNWNEFWLLLKKILKIHHISEDKINELQQIYDINMDGMVNWTEFIINIPDLISKLIKDLDENESIEDWRELLLMDGTKYYYNLRTSISQYEKPNGMIIENT